MFFGHSSDIARSVMHEPGVAEGVTKQSLIGPAEGWSGWVMRRFTLAPGGFTPQHTHPWPHINYVLDGEGTVLLDGEERAVNKGSIAYVPEGEEHRFRNTGESELIFICIVPEEGDK